MSLAQGMRGLRGAHRGARRAEAYEEEEEEEGFCTSTRKTLPPTQLLIKRLMQMAEEGTQRPSLENNAEALFLVIVPMQVRLVRGEVNWINASRPVVWSHPPGRVYDESFCLGRY